MKNIFIKIILLLTFLVFSSFANKTKKQKTKPQNELKVSGVVLSFDDVFVNQWFVTNKKLNKYHWKATFFVSHIHKLQTAEIQKLLQLQFQGHEIGGHSLNHLNAVSFLRKNSIDDYLQQEIDPMIDLMHFYGFNIQAFAYPYGGRTQKLDKALLKNFKFVRGRAFCKEVVAKQGCFYENSKLVFSFSIDESHNHFSINHLKKLLDYAKKNNKILILNSHKTVNTITGKYQTQNATLEFICQYVQKNGMNFYSLSDLSKLNKDNVKKSEFLY